MRKPRPSKLGRGSSSGIEDGPRDYHVAEVKIVWFSSLLGPNRCNRARVSASKSKFGTERNFYTTVVFWTVVEQLHSAKVQYLNYIAFFTGNLVGGRKSVGSGRDPRCSD
jgi:hypothetical protein